MVRTPDQATTISITPGRHGPLWMPDRDARETYEASFWGMGKYGMRANPESFTTEARDIGLQAARAIRDACQCEYTYGTVPQRADWMARDLRIAILLARRAHQFWRAYRLWEFEQAEDADRHRQERQSHV